jgi:hydrogenase nickel incorporation protein HypA/HybF
MSIAESVLEAVRAESERQGGRITRVGVAIGELSGVEPESLRFCFEVLADQSDLAPLGLEIELVPRQNRCLDCGATFRVVAFNLTCTACGSQKTVAAGGDEMRLSYVEVEDP